MKNKLVAASLAILSALAVSSSCNKSNPDPEPEPKPIETYTVNAFYKFNTIKYGRGDTATVSKMLDFYQKQGFIDSHDGSVSSVYPIVLSKTGVTVADTSAVLAALRKELKEKLTNAAKEIKANDWNKTFGNDRFRLGHINLRAITETGEEIDASTYCIIPSVEYGKEYTTEDATQPLQKFTISEEMYLNSPFIRLGKVTFKDKGEMDLVLGYNLNGNVELTVKDITTNRYYLSFDKSSSGKEMTLKYTLISGKKDTVSVKYKTN